MEFHHVDLNPFILNASFPYPLKKSENHKVFWCFQGVEKGCIGNKWVKIFAKRFSILAAFLSHHESHFSSWFFCDLLLCHFNGQWNRQCGFHIHIPWLVHNPSETYNLRAKRLSFLALFSDFYFKSKCNERKKTEVVPAKAKNHSDSWERWFRIKKITTDTHNEVRIWFFLSLPIVGLWGVCE